MAKLTAEVKAAFEGATPVVATCGGFGFPNLTPKGSLRVLDDETLVFSELTGGKTYHNLRDHPVLSVLLLNLEQRVGYQIKGNATFVTEGALFDEAVRLAEEGGRRSPQSVVKIEVIEVWSIWPGQTGEPLVS
jgi:predicted pyridoxine 5'-phosphate oxidase superfamily flavin-nucleotide-binding protein